MHTHNFFSLLLFASFILSSLHPKAQNGVSIGITKPDESAILHIHSDADPKGLLIPRYDEEERDNINSDGDGPAEGLIIYNTDEGAFNYYDGSNWLQLIPTPNKFNLNMSSYKITNLAEGTADEDAANKGQLDEAIDAVDGLNLDVDGSQGMTGNLDIGDNQIINVSDGVNPNDAVNKEQLDNLEIPELFSAVGGSSTFVGGVRWMIIDTGSTERKTVDLTAWSDIQNGRVTIQIRGGATNPSTSEANDLIIQRNFSPNVSGVVSQETLNFGIFNTDYRYFHIRTEPFDGGIIGYYGLKVRIVDTF